MEINSLTVLHFIDNKADKVWGHFYVLSETLTPLPNAARIHYKFWGKRTGKRFQTQIQNPTQLIEDEQKKLNKKVNPYKEAPEHIWKQVRDTLKIQFGITKFKSVVTEEERSVADGIKPSQIYKTIEKAGTRVINFYDKKDNLIGVRAIDHKEKIFRHLEKTRYSIPNPNNKNIIFWNKVKATK